MNKFRNALFSALNILVIVVLLLGIMIGLRSIGIFRFPNFVENFLSKESAKENVLPNDDGKIYDALKKGQSDGNVTVTAELNPQNVRKMLEGVKPKDSYYQEVNTTLYDNSNSVTTKAVVRKSAGKYSVKLYNSEGTLKKEIDELESATQIKVYSSANRFDTVEVPTGSFDMSGESGVVITHENFLNSENELEAADYSMAQSPFGTIMQITFNTSLENYTQTEVYWLSLDYGIVTRCECYEGENLVYKLETIALNDDLN